MKGFPRVKSVQSLPSKRLRVTFDNDEVRVYDCTPLLEEAAFRSLHDDAFFQNVSPDPHGYGVIWSDEVDLAESELWLRGMPEQAAAVGLR
jgi:hypothetical protein